MVEWKNWFLMLLHFHVTNTDYRVSSDSTIDEAKFFRFPLLTFHKSKKKKIAERFGGNDRLLFLLKKVCLIYFLLFFCKTVKETCGFDYIICARIVLHETLFTTLFVTSLTLLKRLGALNRATNLHICILSQVRK